MSNPAPITDKQAILMRARGRAAIGKTQLVLHVADLLGTLTCADPKIEEACRPMAVLILQRATELRSYASKSIYHASAKMMEAGQTARFIIT